MDPLRRNDGVSITEYIDQLTLLIFLKIAEERAEQGSILSGSCPWAWTGTASSLVATTN